MKFIDRLLCVTLVGMTLSASYLYVIVKTNLASKAPVPVSHRPGDLTINVDNLEPYIRAYCTLEANEEFGDQLPLYPGAIGNCILIEKQQMLKNVGGA